MVIFPVYVGFMWCSKPYFSRLGHWNSSNAMLKYMGTIPRHQAILKHSKTRMCDISCVIRCTGKIILTPNNWFHYAPRALASNFHQTVYTSSQTHSQCWIGYIWIKILILWVAIVGDLQLKCVVGSFLLRCQIQNEAIFLHRTNLLHCAWHIFRVN